MSIMTSAATRAVQLPLSGDWTVDDLDALPDDGLRHELLDGILVVTPGPSTRRYDRTAKLSVYEEAGVASYWLVEPDPAAPGVTVLELVDGAYVQQAHMIGDESWTAERPFPITLRPSDLVVDLNP